MFEHDAANAEFCDIEEMVRAAGDYLDVSDDLRPQTLERARSRSRQMTTRSWIAIVAVVVVFLTFSAGMFRGRPSSTPPLVAGVTADSDQLYAAALQKAAQTNVDPSWSLVDAFCALRQRQANWIDAAF